MVLLTEQKNETPLIFGLGFALAIFILNAIGVANDSSTATLIASSLLISVCILFPLPIGFGAVLILLASLSIEQPEFSSLQTIRAAIIASMCMPLTRIFRRLPPFYWVFLIWVLFLISLPHLSFAAHIQLAAHANSLVTTFYTELLTVLVFSIICTTSSANKIFRLRNIEFDSRAYCVQLLSLAVLLTAPIAALFFIGASDISLDTVLGKIVSNPLPFSILIAVLLMLPLILGLVLGQIIHDFTTDLMFAARSQGAAFSERRHWIFSEFKETVCVVLGCIEGLECELRAFQSQARDLANAAENRDQDICDREHRVADLSKLLGDSPWGAIACFADRSIVEINHSLRHLLQLGNQDIRRKDVKSLITSHPWSGELVDILEWCFHNRVELDKLGPQKFFTTSMQGRYLEVNVQAAATATALQASPHKAMEHRSPSEVTITMYCRSIPDVRLFQLSAFSPSRSDIVEKHSMMTCAWISTYLKGILDDTVELTKVTQSLQNIDQFSNLKLLIQDIERLSEEGLTALSGTGKIEQDSKTDEIDFLLHLQNAIGYLSELLTLPQSIPVRLASENPDCLEDTSVAQPLDPHPVLEISSQDLNVFLASLMSFISGILPEAADLYIEIGSEHIGTATANILSSDVSGHFVRVDIHHSGQSITTNVTQRTIAELSITERALQQIEITIVLLSFHTRRLGGFLSVQSSVSRGTEISIYLPVSRPKSGTFVQKAVNASTGMPGQNPFSQHNDQSRHILLISPNNDEVSALTNMLIHLGHHVIFDDAESYTGEDDLAFDSGGHGFGSSCISVFDQADQDQAAAERANEEASLYDVIIVNTTRAYSMNSDQFQAIAKRFPNTTKVVLHEQGAFTPPKDHSLSLKKPFELQDIDRLISGIKAKSDSTDNS